MHLIEVKKETEKEGGILRERGERESFGDISHSRPKVISVLFVKVCIFENQKMHVYLILRLIFKF